MLFFFELSERPTVLCDYCFYQNLRKKTFKIKEKNTIYIFLLITPTWRFTMLGLSVQFILSCFFLIFQARTLYNCCDDQYNIFMFPRECDVPLVSLARHYVPSPSVSLALSR